MSGQISLFDELPAEPLVQVVAAAADSFLEGLNEQQKQAVMAPADQALQVLAGAGTGKTELISRRFVKLVKDLNARGILRPQERILVVTFTNDAALSMRERIHKRLLDNGEEGLTPDAWIGTFHQFCIRLLRAHPLEIGLPPDFSILNTLEQQVLFNRMMHGVLNGDFADISRPLQKAGLHLPADVLSLASLQKSGIDDLEAMLDPARLYKLVNRVKTAGLSPAEFLSQAKAQSKGLTDCLKNLPLPHDPALKSIENIQLKIQAWQDALRPWAHADWQPLAEADAKAEAAGKKATAGNYKDELKALAALFLAPRTFEPITPELDALDAALSQEMALAAIVAAVYALYQDALLSQGACDFDDLINHAIQLLTHHPELQARYRKQFEAIIVDEFQDSNGSQLRLLELLIQDGAKNLTVVGDEKQSIYAFRFAQPENLDLIFRNGPYQKINLQTNYRSRPPVLAAANALTERITARPNQRLQACEKNAVHTEPLVTWVDLDGTRDDGQGKVSPLAVDERKAMEARYIAFEIARLVRDQQYKFSDVAILVKSHGKAEAIQKELAAFNIPSIRQKNLGFFQETVIKDAMALLRLMRNLSDELSLVRILQNKLNQRQLRDLMRLRRQLQESGEALNLFETCLQMGLYRDRLPSFQDDLAIGLSSLATELFEVRRLKPRLTVVQLFQQLARRVGLIQLETPEWQRKQERISLRTFERMLYLFSQNKPLQPTLDEVIETLDQYAADPGQELPVTEDLSGEDAVRIMTVFAAKGLEFPVVFAAYTEKGQVRGADDALLVFDPQFAGKAGFGLIAGKVNGLPNVKREVYQRCWQAPRSRTEAQRVFYVALTRAMEKLYVIRGSQSFDWTAPGFYPDSALEILSETEDELDSLWDVDVEEIRLAMAALQQEALA